VLKTPNWSATPSTTSPCWSSASPPFITLTTTCRPVAAAANARRGGRVPGLAPDGSYLLNIKAHADDGERNLYVMDLVLAHRRKWGWRFVDELCLAVGKTDSTSRSTGRSWPTYVHNNLYYAAFQELFSSYSAGAFAAESKDFFNRKPDRLRLRLCARV